LPYTATDNGISKERAKYVLRLHQFYLDYISIDVLTCQQRAPQPLTSSRKTPSVYSEAAYHEITPLTNLDLSKEDPIKIRPFKPKYHLTMGQPLAPAQALNFE
jgi:hypothetical protein